LRFCYDENVWQRDAVKTGQFALKHGRGFLQHVVPAVLKPLKVLWNQVIGFLFLCMATIFGFKAFRYFQQGDEGRFAAMLGGLLIVAWFGLSSFWRAHKISRS